MCALHGQHASIYIHAGTRTLSRDQPCHLQLPHQYLVWEGIMGTSEGFGSLGLTVCEHVRCSLYPGNTLKAALDAGAECFGAQPQIIFVCLPDTSAPAHAPFASPNAQTCLGLCT